MAKQKLKINVNLLQLLCIFVSVALHGEFERFCRFSGFALTVTAIRYKETRGWKAHFRPLQREAVTVAPWQTKSVPRMLIAPKAAFLENYLAVSA